MYSVPNIEQCMEFAKSMGCSHILEVPIEPREYDIPFQCHNNCSFNPVLGYYIVKDSNQLLHAFKHSVLNTGETLVDVTPTIDNRQYNVFCYGTNITEEHLTYVENSVYINFSDEETINYYVYGLINPYNNKVFLISKGSGDKKLSKFYENLKLNSFDFTPIIEFYAQNIEDVELAEYVENKLKIKYGVIAL